jgi:hypothetical protein
MVAVFVVIDQINPLIVARMKTVFLDMVVPLGAKTIKMCSLLQV